MLTLSVIQFFYNLNVFIPRLLCLANNWPKLSSGLYIVA